MQRLRVAATDRHLPLRGIVAAPGEEQEAGAPSSINRYFTKLLMEMGMPSGSFGCIGTGQTGDILRRDKGGLTVMLYRVTPNSVPDPEACAWALAR